MVTSRTHRWHHIFGDDGKTLIVALDHAAVFGNVEGLEKPGQVIRQVRAGGADAILTTYGVCTRFVDEIGGMGVILRVDGGVSLLSEQRGQMRLTHDVHDALRVGADAVGCMGFPGSRFEAATLAHVSELVVQCAEWNVPVMAEMLPGGFENPSEWWTPENVGHACRIGAELGVDLIKTTYTGDVESFGAICEQVYVPIVVLGGGKSRQPRDLLADIHGAMQAGARGVAVGRNVYRYPEPERMTAAIAAIVHGDATVDGALEYLCQRSER